MEELLKRLKIKEWDVLLVGDGSASSWKNEAGWACVSIERDTMDRTVHIGATNRGTVNLAEIMAYVQALDWLSGREIDRRASQQAEIRAFNVHIITDSDYCRNIGNGEGRTMLKNAGLWAILSIYERHGFILNWHHVRGHTKGEGCHLNRYCDKLSKDVRRHMAKVKGELIDNMNEKQDVHDTNPTEE